MENALTKMAKTLDKTPEMPIATQKILKVLDENKFVFMCGGAGTGKSFNINNLAKYNKGTLVLATTGIASINVSGETFHSFFCIDILKDLTELKQSDLRNKFSDRFKAMEATLATLNLIIIDEISMMNKEQLRMINYRIRNYPRIRLLVVGDFPQIPPVEGRPLYISKVFTENFKVIKLRKQHRQANDIPFQEVLYEVRNACVKQKTKDVLADLENNIVEGSVKLRSTNAMVKEINTEELAKLDGEPKVSYRKITYKHSSVDKYVMDGILNNVREPEVFNYKAGARVLITKNIKTKDMYNGDLATIVANKGDIVLLQLDRNNRKVWIEPQPYTHEITLSGRKTIAIKYTALPLILGYALTMHKSQGLTLPKIDIDCQGIFQSQMFYVALSRARTLEGVQLHNTAYLKFKKNRKLKLKWYTK